MHDGDFLAHFVGHLPKWELQKLAILAPASVPGVLLVHDLVCKAVRKGGGATDFAREIERYIDQLQGEMTPSVLRQIHLSRAQLLQEHHRRGKRDPDWLLYGLLQIEEVKKDVFDVYAGRAIDPGGSLAALISTIDAREQYAYTLDYEERQGYYATCAEEFSRALDATEGRVRAELLHHLGKAYRRCGEINKALDAFQQLLRLDPTWHATHGQIAHLGAQHGAGKEAKEAGQQSLRHLVVQMMGDPAEVPLRVAMAALSNLRSYAELSNEINGDEKSVRALGEVITQSALEGLDQFYDAFLAFTSKFSYRHPQVVFELVSAAGDMFEVSPASIGKKHLLSVGEALANVAQSALRSGDGPLARKLSGLGAIYADALLESGPPDAYAARGIAKIFTVAEEPAGLS